MTAQDPMSLRNCVCIASVLEGVSVDVCASTRLLVSVAIAASMVLVMSVAVPASEKVGVGSRVALLESGKDLVLTDWRSGQESRSDGEIGNVLDSAGCFGIVVGEED